MRGVNCSNRAVAVLCAVISLALASCSTDSGPVGCPDCSCGWIEGRVTSGNGPVSARVKAGPRDPFVDDAAELTARTDSTGWYELAVPWGKYVLSVDLPGVVPELFHSLEGAVEYRGRAADLVVSPQRGPVRADFLFAAARVTVETPPELDEAPVHCHLEILGSHDPDLRAGVVLEQVADDGRAVFHFPALLPGSYQIKVYLGYLDEVYLPPTHRQEDADTLTVDAGRLALYDAGIASGATITGTVRGSWRILGVDPPQTAMAFGADSLSMHSVAVGPGGDFRVCLFAPETVRLMVVIGGVRRWVGGSSFASATSFELTPGRQFQVDEVESGILCDLESSTLWTEARGRIQVYTTSGTPVAALAAVGSCAIPNLVPGSYYVHVRPDEGQQWRPMWYEQADSMSAATPVVISAPGEVVPIVVHLVDGGP